MISKKIMNILFVGMNVSTLMLRRRPVLTNIHMNHADKRGNNIGREKRMSFVIIDLDKLKPTDECFKIGRCCQCKKIKVIRSIMDSWKWYNKVYKKEHPGIILSGFPHKPFCERCMDKIKMWERIDKEIKEEREKMAYGNWGAKVWKNGKAMHNHCDTSIKELFKQEFDNLDLNHFDMSGHAIVGDTTSGCVIILYKNYFSQIFKVEEGKLKMSKCELDDIDSFEDLKKEFKFYGIDIKYEKIDNKIYISFGVWKAVSGMDIGEGHEEWGDE